jgi:hypothetical protein
LDCLLGFVFGSVVIDRLADGVRRTVDELGPASDHPVS